MKINTIYQQSKFELIQNYVIKTEEQTIYFNQNLESTIIESTQLINAKENLIMST